MNNIKKIINSDAAYDILDSSNSHGSTWTSGGCAILARAISKLKGYPLFVIYNEKYGVEHFGVINPIGQIIDGDGIHKDAESWLRFFKKNESPRPGRLSAVPYDALMNIEGIYFDDHASDALTLFLKNKIEESAIRAFARRVILESVFSEAAFKMSNLPSGASLFLEESGSSFELCLLDPTSEFVYGSIAAHKPKNSEGNFSVGAVAAEKGFGPMMYEFAMYYASNKGVGLMPSRDGDVREGAFSVWKKFYMRADIKKITFDKYSPYFRFDIITGDDETYDSSEVDEFFEELDEESIEALTIFNSVYYISADSGYNDLINRGKEYIKNGFTIEKAFSLSSDFFSDKYDES